MTTMNSVWTRLAHTLPAVLRLHPVDFISSVDEVDKEWVSGSWFLDRVGLMKIGKLGCRP